MLIILRVEIRLIQDKDTGDICLTIDHKENDDKLPSVEKTRCSFIY